jgi:hypothetical protein
MPNERFQAAVEVATASLGHQCLKIDTTIEKTR